MAANGSTSPLVIDNQEPSSLLLIEIGNPAPLVINCAGGGFERRNPRKNLYPHSRPTRIIQCRERRFRRSLCVSAEISNKASEARILEENVRLRAPCPLLDFPMFRASMNVPCSDLVRPVRAVKDSLRATPMQKCAANCRRVQGRQPHTRSRNPGDLDGIGTGSAT